MDDHVRLLHQLGELLEILKRPYSGFDVELGLKELRLLCVPHQRIDIERACLGVCEDALENRTPDVPCARLS